MFMIVAFICFQCFNIFSYIFPCTLKNQLPDTFPLFQVSLFSFHLTQYFFFIFILQLTISFCANQTFLYMFISSSMTRNSMHNKKSLTWFQKIMQLFTPYTVYYAFCVERKAVQKKYGNIIHSQDFIFSLRHEY